MKVFNPWQTSLLDAEADEDFDADLAEICAQVRHTGRIGTTDAYTPASEDSWRSFRRRHGTYGFDFKWDKWIEAERLRREEEQAAEARLEARRREQRIAEKLLADQQWWDAAHPPAPKPKPKSRIVIPDQVWTIQSHWPGKTNVEPWFDPRRTPTQDDIREITKYAASYFAAALRVDIPRIYDPTGEPQVTIECARDADAIAGVLYQLATNHRAQIPGFSGMRVTSTEDGKSVRIAIETHR